MATKDLKNTKNKYQRKDFFSYNPFISNNKASLLTIMVDLNEYNLVNKLNILFKKLFGEDPRLLQKHFHITLFSLFINVDDFVKYDKELYHYFKLNFRKEVNNAIILFFKKSKKNIDLTYLDDNNIQNYEILGQNRIMDNFFAKVFHYNKEFVDTIEHLKFFVLQRIFRNKIVYHSHDDLLHYYTFPGSTFKLIGIHKHYDYTEMIFPRPFIHVTLCRVNQIKNIKKLLNIHQKLDLLDKDNVEISNNDVLDKIFENYLKKKENKISINKESLFTLYPLQYNRINVTLLEKNLKL